MSHAQLYRILQHLVIMYSLLIEMLCVVTDRISDENSENSSETD